MMTPYKTFEDYSDYLANRTMPDHGTADFFNRIYGDQVPEEPQAQPTKTADLRLLMDNPLPLGLGGVFTKGRPFTDAEQRAMDARAQQRYDAGTSIFSLGDKPIPMQQPAAPIENVDGPRADPSYQSMFTGESVNTASATSAITDTGHLSQAAFAPIGKPREGAGSLGVGMVEATRSMGGILASGIPAIVSGLWSVANGGSRQDAEAEMAKTASAVAGHDVGGITPFAFNPSTKEGKVILEQLVKALETAGIPSVWVGKQIEAVTGSSGAGFAGEIILDPLNFIGLAIAAKTGKFSKAGKSTATPPVFSAAKPPSLNALIDNPVSPPPDTIGAANDIAAGNLKPNTGNTMVRSAIGKIVKGYNNGTLDPKSAVQQISDLGTRLAADAADKILNPEQKPRGMDSVLAGIRRDVADGRVSRAGADILEWAIRKNPSLASDLAYSSDKKLLPGAYAAGMYDTQSSTMIVRAFLTLEGKDTTPVHEFFHHTERALPPKIGAGVARSWVDATTKRLISATEAGDTDMVAMLTSALDGDHGQAGKLFSKLSKSRGDMKKEYQYLNASEYWADNAAFIMRDRSSSTGKAALSYYTEFAEKMKDAAGFNSKSQVYEAIRALKGVGSGRGPDMLVGVDPAPARSTTEKVARKAAAGGAVAAAGYAAYDDSPERRARVNAMANK